MKALLRRMWAVSFAWPLVVVLAGGGVGIACTETEYVYDTTEVERPLFNQPADSINGFLGLYSVADNQTACGQCHADYQGEWAGTRHADAWATLENSGSAQDFCRGCHTVSELGNALEEAGGWNAITDSAGRETYHNVQCESCHGPGLTHLESVAAGNVVRPYASIAVDSVGTNGCAGCHNGTHHPFVEQWSKSKHGYGASHYLSYGDRSPCKECHEGRGALVAKFRVDADYVEKDGSNFQPITCAVCHDPHDATYDGQLRADLAEPSREQICVSCHSREGSPEPGSYTRRGPHAAQGLLVIDEEVGWIPPNFEYDTTRIVGSHGTSANPRLCASCHVYMFEVTDKATGDFLLQSVGHTFEAIQCLDVQGLPTEGPCADEQRQFGGCAVSGCHGDQAAALAALRTVRTRMNFLVDQLWADTDGDEVMETTDRGILPDILAQAIAANNFDEMNLYDLTLTPAEGAIWNAQLAYTSQREVWSGFSIDGQNSCYGTTGSSACPGQGRGNTAHPSSGEGVHNPFLLEALLLSSISYLQSYYNLAPPPMELTPQLMAPPGLRVK